VCNNITKSLNMESLYLF